MSDKCPKCKERKKKRFSDDISEIKKIFRKTKKLQTYADRYLDNFINDDLTKACRQRNSVFMRRKIDEINKLGLTLRKIILNYKKKMLEHKIETNLKNKKNESNI